MATRQEAITSGKEWVTSGGFETALATLVSYPTESQRPDNDAALRSYLDQALTPLLQSLDCQIEIIENPVPGASPFLLAERQENPDLPTILIYGHGDVVHGQKGKWAKGRDPFSLSREGDRLYGRGSADNKSQHLINLKALDIVRQARGALGFNLKILIEMGEETGSPGLEEFVQQHHNRLRADVLIASDGPRLLPETPTVFTGSRGAVNFSLSLNLRNGAHHSGNWGGLLADPAMILSAALASISDQHGSLKIPEWRPNSLTDELRVHLKQLPLDQSGDPAISPEWGEPGLSGAERLFGWNSFAILALDCGDANAPQNAINGAATAHCQLRFVVGTDEADILPALRRHLDRGGFEQVMIQTDHAIAPATRMDTDHPWVNRATQSIKTTTGAQPHLLPNLGGFIPNHVFCDMLDLPTVWIPHSYAGCSQHAPDEHVLLPVAKSAMEVMCGLFWDIAKTN